MKSIAGRPVKAVRKNMIRLVTAVSITSLLAFSVAAPVSAAANSPKYNSYSVCKGWQIYYKVILKKTITIPCWKPAPDKWLFNYS